MRYYFRFKPDFSAVKRRLNYWKLCFQSLTYNSYSSASEVLFEPIVTIVNFAARWFGFAFVTLVIVLTTYVVVAYYTVTIPYLREKYSPFRAFVTIAYGHYLLVMIVFHYYNGVRTDPGRPPKDASEVAVTSVCKKCILPKPPRTHHCSVCRNCVLKMDHHCPWLNGCVGHFNQRYFISFCIFMWLGTVFVMTTTWPLFHDCFNVPFRVRYTIDTVHYYLGTNTDQLTGKNSKGSQKDEMLLKNEEEPNRSKGNIEIFSHPVNFQLADEKKNVFEGKSLDQDVCIGKDTSFKNNVVFLWLLCTGVTGALGTLTAIQFRLISRGETSIEKLINDKERRKAKKNKMKFVNPYNLGLIENWKLLLCFRDFKSFVKNVLLPRKRLPAGNGLVWDKYINKNYGTKYH